MISIVIPTINEEKNIGKTLIKINNISELSKAEIIIVDDDSEDRTLDIVESFKKKINLKVVKNKKRLGLGYALNRGFKISKNPFVMFIDADLSVKKNDIIKLYSYREQNSMVIGSRYLRNSRIFGASELKVKLSFYLNYITSKIFNLPVIDLSHSFRIISKKISIKSKNFSHPGFFWELTINANRRNKKIKEIPISFYDRKYGISKNNSVKMLRSVIISYFNLLK
tara:strand:+ start:120 stop:794 length:675 start_codon:yes stop_codon:yes gene_type:complete